MGYNNILVAVADTMTVMIPVVQKVGLDLILEIHGIAEYHQAKTALIIEIAQIVEIDTIGTTVAVRIVSLDEATIIDVIDTIVVTSGIYPIFAKVTC